MPEIIKVTTLHEGTFYAEWRLVSPPLYAMFDLGYISPATSDQDVDGFETLGNQHFIPFGSMKFTERSQHGRTAPGEVGSFSLAQ